MSDFAAGWVLWGIKISTLLATLKAEKQAAIVRAGGRPIRAFVKNGDKCVEAISSKMPKATILTYSTGDDWGSAALVYDGRTYGKVTCSGSLSEPLHVRRASELLTVACRRLRKVPATVELDEPIPSGILEALGVDYEQVSYQSYDTLYADRFEVESGKENDFICVTTNGQQEPYAVAFRPPLDARNKANVVLAPASTPAALLEGMRQLDPSRATAAARKNLETLVTDGPSSKCTLERAVAVREAAASLLGRCLEALPAKERNRQVTSFAKQMLRADNALTRAMLAKSLRRVGESVAQMLEQALEREQDPAAARRAYEALRGIQHDLSDAELLARTASSSVVERKGAYALLEQSASPRVLRELEERLPTERDVNARALLETVLDRLRDELGP